MRANYGRGRIHAENPALKKPSVLNTMGFFNAFWAGN